MNANLTKISISAILAAISAYFGVVAIPMLLLLILMIIDYVTGLTSAWANGTISSKKSIQGILKKVGYLAVIVVAMTSDFLIKYALSLIGEPAETTYFIGLIVIVWLILNECISILENLTEIGVPIPGFLKRIVNHLKVVTEKEADIIQNNITRKNDTDIEDGEDGEDGENNNDQDLLK